ncbi:electron transport complex subunit RsxC [Thermodesulforhabdus norvegica]|uniref:Ion-translocating oxidoreductase complex subunit C n=1 Tax=Thermodesulforhabdus norvegica TaxID=39841 RepID=A0A1I4R9Z2_9BACT|nr:electron transport complex subunit RsxC [Thermodesulforhabdus norvegica]SFM48723.1 electron transport complex protein RnfC [Thermodesulforhabdus norvegica]
MLVRALKKGVHPAECKFTAGDPIREFPLPELLYVPLQQHMGRRAKPLVKKGDVVKKGQKIGEADGFISAPVHAPAAGKVKALERVMLPNGVYDDAVVIEVDSGDDELAEPSWPIKPLEELSPEDIRLIAREAGIVGLGGATFPTAVKLTPPDNVKIDTLLINGAECEPFLTADHRLMFEKTREIIEGAELVRRAVGAERVFIGIEENKGDAVEKFDELLRNRAGWEVVSLKSIYPQGAEKNLIKVITGREVPVGGLPFNVNVAIQNVGTVYSLYRAAVEGVPLIERVVTVSGDGVAERGNYIIRFGVMARRVLEKCGADFDGIEKVVFGGPMMGMSLKGYDVPVIKSTSGIITFKKAFREEARPCLNCGKCVHVCTLGIAPTRVVKYIRAGKWSEAKKAGLLNCMECGCCAFICPSRIPLVQWLRYGKFMLRKMEAQK